MENAAPDDLWELTPDALTSLAASGDAEAQHVLGDMLDVVVHDALEAVKWWQKAAAQGHAGAMNDLGAAYECGSGVAQDAAAAFAWYSRAAALGNALAMANIGRAYELGIGVEMNAGLMVQWYRRGRYR